MCLDNDFPDWMLFPSERGDGQEEATIRIDKQTREKIDKQRQRGGFDSNSEVIQWLVDKNL